MSSVTAAAPSVDPMIDWMDPGSITAQQTEERLESHAQSKDGHRCKYERLRLSGHRSLAIDLLQSAT